jgi:hypothetical protein
MRSTYSGVFIMQAFRDDEGLEVFQSQLEWIRPYLKPWLKETRTSAKT